MNIQLSIQYLNPIKKVSRNTTVATKISSNISKTNKKAPTMISSKDHSPIRNEISGLKQPVHCSKEYHIKAEKAEPFQAIYLPKNVDVIIGNGSNVSNHLGNRILKDIIASKLETYASFSARKDKTSMIRSIVHQIHVGGGIFIRKSKKTGTWLEVDSVAAREKVSQAFRNSIYRKCLRPDFSTESKKYSGGDKTEPSATFHASFFHEFDNLISLLPSSSIINKEDPYEPIPFYAKQARRM